MGQTIFRTDSRIVLPWLVLTGTAVLLMALGARLLADPDTYSHIAVGRWVIENGIVPAADPFTQFHNGQHWVAFEWLAQVIYALAFRLGGWTSVAGLSAVAVGTTLALLAHVLLREWKPVPVLIAVLAAIMLWSPHIVARPHLLAMPLMIVWIAALIRANDDARKAPWWLLAIMPLWANLHGSFIFGLMMLGPIGLEALLNAKREDRPRVFLRWLGFGIAALVAACINPYGPGMILATFQTAALGEALTVITEWQPQNFAKFGAYELVLLAAIGTALWRGVRVPPLRIVMLLGVLHMSLVQSRHADLLGLLAPLFVARPLAMQFAGLAAERSMRAWRGMGLPAAVSALTIIVVCLGVSRLGIEPPARITPAKALASFDARAAGPILNDYDFGAYMDFVGLSPFIDGRAELYGTAFIVRHDRALSLQNLPDFLKLLDDYKIRTTLLTPQTPATALLDRLPEWQRIYADDVAVVHRRR